MQYVILKCSRVKHRMENCCGLHLHIAYSHTYKRTTWRLMYLNAGRLASGLLQWGAPACSLGASGLGERPVEPPSREWAPFSRTFVLSSATNWSKFLLRPTTFLRWWMEWICRAESILNFYRVLKMAANYLYYVEKCYKTKIWRKLEPDRGDYDKKLLFSFLKYFNQSINRRCNWQLSLKQFNASTLKRRTFRLTF